MQVTELHTTEEGSTLLIVALVMTLAAFMLVFCVDFGKASFIKSKTQFAADSASQGAITLLGDLITDQALINKQAYLDTYCEDHPLPLGGCEQLWVPLGMTNESDAMQYLAIEYMKNKPPGYHGYRDKEFFMTDPGIKQVLKERAELIAKSNLGSDYVDIEFNYPVTTNYTDCFSEKVLAQSDVSLKTNHKIIFSAFSKLASNSDSPDKESLVITQRAKSYLNLCPS